MKSRADIGKTISMVSCFVAACAMAVPSTAAATTSPALSAPTGAAIGPASVPSFASFVKRLPQLPPDEALASWLLHLSPTATGQGAQGKAIEAQLLIRNGLFIQGLELLFSIKKPSTIHPSLIQQISAQVPANHPAWDLAQLSWTSDWRQAFPQVAAKLPIPKTKLTSRKQLRALALAMTRVPKNSPTFYRLSWELGLWAMIFSENQTAEQELTFLLTTEQNVIPRDQVLLTLARLYYQDKRFNEALSTYEQIEKSSDYWLRSLEEKAWTYTQLGNTDRALSQLKTVLSPVLAANASAESYFLASFLNLRVCNYESVFQIHRLFKQRFGERVAGLERIVKNEKNPAVGKAIRILQERPQTTWNNSSELEALPLYFHRDRTIREASLQLQALNYEWEQTQRVDNFLKSRGLAGGLNSSPRNMDRQIQQRQELIYQQIASFAQRDLAEAARAITRMQVLEADAIHRLHLMTEKVVAPNPRQIGKDDKHAISFPETSEVWLDELDNYRVKATRCPVPQGGKKL